MPYYLRQSFLNALNELNSELAVLENSASKSVEFKDDQQKNDNLHVVKVLQRCIADFKESIIQFIKDQSKDTIDSALKNLINTFSTIYPNYQKAKKIDKSKMPACGSESYLAIDAFLNFLILLLNDEFPKDDKHNPDEEDIVDYLIGDVGIKAIFVRIYGSLYKYLSKPDASYLPALDINEKKYQDLERKVNEGTYNNSTFASLRDFIHALMLRINELHKLKEKLDEKIAQSKNLEDAELHDFLSRKLAIEKLKLDIECKICHYKSDFTFLPHMIKQGEKLKFYDRNTRKKIGKYKDELVKAESSFHMASLACDFSEFLEKLPCKEKKDDSISSLVTEPQSAELSVTSVPSLSSNFEAEIDIFKLLINRLRTQIDSKNLMNDLDKPNIPAILKLDRMAISEMNSVQLDDEENKINVIIKSIDHIRLELINIKSNLALLQQHFEQLQNQITKHEQFKLRSQLEELRRKAEKNENKCAFIQNHAYNMLDAISERRRELRLESAKKATVSDLKTSSAKRKSSIETMEPPSSLGILTVSKQEKSEKMKQEEEEEAKEAAKLKRINDNIAKVDAAFDSIKKAIQDENRDDKAILDIVKQDLFNEIDKYIDSTMCINFYGRKRARQLIKLIDDCKTLRKLKEVLKDFLLNGKTESDSHFYNRFFSPTLKSSLDGDSLQGRIAALYDCLCTIKDVKKHKKYYDNFKDQNRHRSFEIRSLHELSNKITLKFNTFSKSR